MLSGMKGSRHRAIVVALILLILLAACGDEGVVDELVARSPTPDADVGASSPADPEPVEHDSASPTPTATPDADGVYVVPCNDIHAPLDKLHRLEADCAPVGLVAIPAAYSIGPQEVIDIVLPHLLALFEAAAAAGHRIAVVSSYRSYATQAETYRYHVNDLGLEQASRVSARAGHSEHQLGTTVDFSSAAVGFDLVQAFGDTPEGRWLAGRAHEFGFVMSYPEGLEDVTGYDYEPWHFRWVGQRMAEDVRARGLTLGEYLLR